MPAMMNAPPPSPMTAESAQPTADVQQNAPSITCPDCGCQIQLTASPQASTSVPLGSPGAPPEGSPQEEASESPGQEAMEQAGGQGDQFDQHEGALSSQRKKPFKKKGEVAGMLRTLHGHVGGK